jgi:hypothetical protein
VLVREPERRCGSAFGEHGEPPSKGAITRLGMRSGRAKPGVYAGVGVEGRDRRSP